MRRHLSLVREGTMKLDEAISATLAIIEVSLSRIQRLPQTNLEKMKQICELCREASTCFGSARKIVNPKPRPIRQRRSKRKLRRRETIKILVLYRHTKSSHFLLLHSHYSTLTIYASNYKESTASSEYTTGRIETNAYLKERVPQHIKSESSNRCGCGDVSEIANKRKSNIDCGENEQRKQILLEHSNEGSNTKC